MVRLLSRVLLAGLTVALAAGSLVRPRPASPARGARRRRLHPDHVVLGDGTRLPLSCWQPQGLPKALVLGLHGYGDYRQSFAALGNWLAQRGIALLAYDQRGFGETGSRGVWPGARPWSRIWPTWSRRCAPTSPACRWSCSARAWAARSRSPASAAARSQASTG